jgi:arsenate reductase (glutaredoxin)
MTTVMTTVVYGIPNCDTVKKARAWLDAAGTAYQFHDYKKAGVPLDRLEAWCATHGYDAVLNRAGTTFRKLPDSEKAGLDRPRALALMQAYPSMIKRPILEHCGQSTVGFDANRWTTVLKKR